MIYRRALQWATVVLVAACAWYMDSINFHVRHFPFFVSVLLVLSIALVAVIAGSTPRDGAEAEGLDDGYDEEGDS